MKFQNFNTDKLKDYTYQMYEKEIQMLLDTCVVDGDQPTDPKIQLYSKDVPPIIQKARHMVYWVSVLKWSVYLLIWSQVFELFMIFMHNNEALNESNYNWIINLRHLFGLSCILFCFFCTWGIYKWDGIQMVQALGSHKCSSDAVLQATFTQMTDYLRSA